MVRHATLAVRHREKFAIQSLEHYEGSSPRQNSNSMESRKRAIAIPERDTAVSLLESSCR